MSRGSRRPRLVRQRGHPRQCHVPDQPLVGAETVLANLAGRVVTWRHGTAPRGDSAPASYAVRFGFTRWVDGQYALNQPEPGLSKWENGRLLAAAASFRVVASLHCAAASSRPNYNSDADTSGHEEARHRLAASSCRARSTAVAAVAVSARLATTVTSVAFGNASATTSLSISARPSR